MEEIIVDEKTFDIHELLEHVDKHGGGNINIEDGWGSTMHLICVGQDLFEYEDLGTEKCEKTAAELVEMYPDMTFTLEE